MKQRRHLAIVAGAATVLAATALASVYESKSGPLFIIQSPNWFLYIVTVVAAVVAGSIGARALRAPVWAQPIGGAFALLIYVTVIFGDGFLGDHPDAGHVRDAQRPAQHRLQRDRGALGPGPDPPWAAACSRCSAWASSRSSWT